MPGETLATSLTQRRCEHSWQSPLLLRLNSLTSPRVRDFGDEGTCKVLNN